jgi:16S rRNA (adenine1518-N6/adenine1519-N6)-dimethyltransferase
MQTLQEIRELLESFGLAPQRRFGQNFLIDQNLLLKVVELAEVDPGRTVLEVGPGTGSLTEELLARAGKVVAVEIDSGMHRLLQERLAGKGNLVLLHQDILVGKHALSPEVVGALGPSADLVANLPYNIATPLVAQCLVSSWEAERVSGIGIREAGKKMQEDASAAVPEPPNPESRTPNPEPRIPNPEPRSSTRFDRLTFTVQQEVADRMVAPHGSWEYGPVSVIVALLGKARFGHAVPNTSFWPKPQIASRMMRIDFDAAGARRLADVRTLQAVVALAFGQRRKQIGSVIHRKNAAFEPEDFSRALDAAAIPRTVRAEQITPEQFLAAANALAGKLKSPAIEPDEEP